MQTHDLEPGSPAWHAHRARHFNASDAPAMMGCDTNRSRNELLHQMHTGITQEFTDWVMANIIDPGHGFEALARPRAEEVMGEDLYPTVGTNGDLSASYDGLSFDELRPWEHKRLNNELRAVMTEGAKGNDLPLRYQVQMEHQCLVSGAKRVLFTASEWDDDETCRDIRHVWYTSNPELADQIIAGWRQFAIDLKAYVPPKAKPEATIKKVTRSLPALIIDIKGEVRTSNLVAYQAAAIDYIAGINTDLKTDQDFADASTAVTFCQASEDRLKLVKEQALAQASSIEELFRTIDVITEEFRQKRLALDKLVTRRKDEIKREIAETAQANLDNHVKTLNERLTNQWIPRRVAAFGEAMKNKRTVESLQGACDDLVATEKIALSALADRLALNRTKLMVSEPEGVKDYFFLFADFATLGAKASEDFLALAMARINQHRTETKAAEDKRVAEAIAAATPVAPPPAAPAPQPATMPVASLLGAGLAGFVAGRRAAVAEPSTRPPLTSSELNALVGDGFNLTVSFITGTLKIQPVPTPVGKRVGSGTYWAADDVPKILAALIDHLMAVDRIYSGGDAKKVG